MAKFSQRSLNNLEGVHPDLVRLMEAAIVDTPVDFTIVEGVRTEARQKELYAQGRTKPGPRVTNADGVTHKSNHQPHADGYGHAVDVYPYYNGSVRVDEPYVDNMLTQLAGHVKNVARNLGIKLTWGGDWKSPYDPPHFEVL